MDFESGVLSEEKSDIENSDQDQYHESDTADDIPDPNTEETPLFQDVDKMPEAIKKQHFEIGMIYFMSMEKDREHPFLAMVTDFQDVVFTYRVFYVRGSARQTQHHGGKDKKAQIADVQRLAPRREFFTKRRIDDIYLYRHDYTLYL